jgi:hypothetical protein
VAQFAPNYQDPVPGVVVAPLLECHSQEISSTPGPVPRQVILVFVPGFLAKTHAVNASSHPVMIRTLSRLVNCDLPVRNLFLVCVLTFYVDRTKEPVFRSGSKCLLVSYVEAFE